MLLLVSESFYLDAATVNKDGDDEHEDDGITMVVGDERVSSLDGCRSSAASNSLIVIFV